MNKQLKIVVSVFLTLSFLVYITISIDWLTFLGIVDNINLSHLLLASVTYLVSYYLRAVRIKLLIDDPSLKTKQVLGVAFLHNFYNRILPARIGDFSLIYLLKKATNVNVTSSISIFVYIKLYDFLISILLLAFSYTILYKFNMVSSGIWITTILLLFLTMKPTIVFKLFKRILQRCLHWKMVRTVDVKIGEMIKQANSVESNRQRLSLFLTSLVIWLLIFVLFVFLFLSINQSFGLWDTLFATTLSNFSWVLPINGVGGFGTMEVSMAFAFSMRGFPFHDLLVYSLYINVVVFLLSAVFAIVPYIMLIRKENRK